MRLGRENATTSTSLGGTGTTLHGPASEVAAAREDPPVSDVGTPSFASPVLPQSRHSFGSAAAAAAAAAVLGSSPLETRPGPAARRVLRTLRMYVTRLRVTRDSEAKAEDIDWKEILEEHRTSAAVAIQRWARRIRKDTTMIFLAKQRANSLRYTRDKAKRQALADEERQVLAARQVLKRQQMRIIREQEAVETILRGSMVREADKRFWMARAKIQAPIMRVWRTQVWVEARFRRAARQRSQELLTVWRASIAAQREGLAAVVKIQQAWVEHRKRCQRREILKAVTARQQRVKAFMIQALGRNAGDLFDRWKRFTTLSTRVKLMGGGHVRGGMQLRLQRWKKFATLAKLERHEAASRLQAMARARGARMTVKALRLERRAIAVITRQLVYHIRAIRGDKLKQQMVRQAAEALAFRKQRDVLLSTRVLQAWRRDARGRGSVRSKILDMARRRERRVLRAATLGWRRVALHVLRERLEEKRKEAEISVTRRSAATLMQAIWRSYSQRKGFDERRRKWRAAGSIQKRWRGFRVRSTTRTKAELHQGALALQRLFRGHRARSRYLSFSMREAARAASTGRYERLFWLTDMWPALTQQGVFSAGGGSSEPGTGPDGGGVGGGEGILHLACRAVADRCVQLCLWREANVRAVTPGGLTPLHCLGLHNAYGGHGDAAGHNLFPDGCNGNTSLSMKLPASALSPASPSAAATEPEATGARTASAPQRLSVDSSDAERQRHRQQQHKKSIDRSVKIIADLLLDAGAELEAVDSDGNTPLLTAAANGDAALCELLIARGAKPSARNYSGSSALFMALMGNSPAEISACVRVLLDTGSDPNESRPDGTAALHVSAKNGHFEVLESLLQRGASVDAVDAAGATPLMYAVANDHGAAAGVLCDYGADLDLVDKMGRTALHVASQCGHTDALKEVLGRSVDVDARDDLDETALHKATYSGKVEVVQALLESGADPNLQNLRGDNAAHIASRAGYLEIVKALVAYDIHIGQRNWQEYTPFGEARMNCHNEVAAFLSANFVRAGGGQCEDIDTSNGAIDTEGSIGTNTDATGSIRSGERRRRQQQQQQQQHQQRGEEGWDREMEEKLEGWEKKWDEESQRFYYANAKTWETSYAAPVRFSADRVQKLREGAEVGYIRKVAPVKGESLLGLSDYRDAYQAEKDELSTHKLRHHAATTIQSGWRVRTACTRANRLRLERRSASKILRFFGRVLGRRRRKVWSRMLSACLAVQRVFRGSRARRAIRKGEAEARWLQAELHLNRLLTRLYRGHLYGRKPARKLRAQNEAAWWGPAEWKAVLYCAGQPLRTFHGWTGHWEAYLFQDSVDVMFYRNADTEEYTWDLPSEWQEKDAYDFCEREHRRIYGFTAEEARAATMLQNAWRGKAVRNHFHLLMRAQRICRGAEAAYLADPDSLRCQINYLLFTHVIEKDYDRARILYDRALAAMEERGPDVQLLLFAYAIFCLVTGDEDWVSVLSTVERAIAAGAAAAEKKTKGGGEGIRPIWPAESYTSRRNPPQFALAEAGFFRFVAYNVNDAESWHNYAACRQLAYGDYSGASECYLRAIEINPKDTHLQANYQILMDTFPEESQGSSTFESLTSHNRSQADSENRRKEIAAAKFLKRPEVKQAVLKIERAYLRSRQQQIDNIGYYLGPTGMLLREVQAEALARQREQCASAGSGNHRGRRTAPWLSIPSPPGSRTSDLLSIQQRVGGSLSSAALNRDGREGAQDSQWALEGPVTILKGSETAMMHGFETATDVSGANVIGNRPSLLPSGWDTGEDEEGNEYYLNAETGESRWDRPPEDAGTITAGDEDLPLVATATSAGSDGGSLWEEFQTEEGLPFWYNASTGQSSWSPPGCHET